MEGGRGAFGRDPSYAGDMDIASIIGAAVCMVGMCGAMMWAMMRFGHRSSGKRDDDERSRPTRDTP
jgi:hypothetical protein